MDELDALCVQIEAVGRGAVEVVALDRTAKSFGMSAMHAKLVGATGLRVESYAVFV